MNCQWVKITDRLPEYDGWYLVRESGSDENLPAEWRKGNWAYSDLHIAVQFDTWLELDNIGE